MKVGSRAMPAFAFLVGIGSNNKEPTVTLEPYWP